MAYNKLLQYNNTASKSLPNVYAFISLLGLHSNHLGKAEFDRLSDSVIQAKIEDTLEQRRIFLIDKLLANAEYLYDTTHFNNTDTVNEKPIRRGIKYAWGSKDFNKKI